MLKRAWTVLEIKSVDEEQRVITGIASSASVDRAGDIVEPLGAEFKLPIPLLWQHNSREPVGEVFAAKATKNGIEIKARFAKTDIPGKLKDRLDEAWQSVALKLVRGLSIGFKSLEESYDKATGGSHFLKWLWLELSCVTIPANADANIQTIKSLDTWDGVSATDPSVDHKPAGVPASPRVIQMRTGHHMKKSYAEQIQDWQNKRAANAARMDDLQTKAGDEGRSKDEAEREEFATLGTEIKGIDEELADLRVLEANAKSAAKIVAGGDTGEAARSRAGHTPSIHVVEKQLPPGLRFARFVMAKAAVRAQQVEYASDYIKHFFPDDHQLIEYAKTAVAAGTTANAQAPLLQYTDIQTEFIEFLRPMTILGKFGQNGVPDVTHVPFNVRVGTQTAGGSASWVGEGKPKPLTKGTFGTLTMDFTKLAAISVLTKEEVRFPSLSAQTKVRDDLTRAIAQQIDKDFIDPANLGSAGVKPASITAGIVATMATATTAVALAVDIRTAIEVMLAAGIQGNSLVAIMSQSQALSLSLMRTSLGVRNYPDVTRNGGLLEGIPVITSQAITAVGSPATGMIVLVNAEDVFLADDGNTSIMVSDQASLEMSDAPTQDATTGGGASMVSMFQTNSLAILAEREINWKLVRAASVQYIASPAYVPQ